MLRRREEEERRREGGGGGGYIEGTGRIQGGYSGVHQGYSRGKVRVQ